jgi:hypothetical protein
MSRNPQIGFFIHFTDDLLVKVTHHYQPVLLSITNHHQPVPSITNHSQPVFSIAIWLFNIAMENGPSK